jgi:hypothetical protein
MTSRLDALCVRARDPQQLARFWAGVLRWGLDIQADIVLVPNDHTGFRIRFLPTREQKVGENQMHFDLTPPVDGDLEAEVERLVSLGATRVNIGQGGVPWVAMADPDGNEFRSSGS